MRKVLLVGTMASTLVLSSVALAAAPSLINDTPAANNSGVYVGLQLGYAKSHYDKGWLKNHTKVANQISTISSVDDDGFAGRLYLGYAFNQYFAAELGGVYLPKIQFNKISAPTVSANKFGMDFNQYIIDMFVRGSIPFDGGFSLYGKAGAAYVHRDSIDRTVNGTKVQRNISQNKYVPAVGVGVAYNFTKQMYADVSYTRYFGGGNLEATDLVTAGIGYLFS